MKPPLSAIFTALVVMIVAGESLTPCPFNCFFTALGDCLDGNVLNTKCFCVNEQQERELYRHCMKHVCADSGRDVLSYELYDACHRGGKGQFSSVDMVDLTERMKVANGGEMGKVLAGRQYSVPPPVLPSVVSPTPAPMHSSLPSSSPIWEPAVSPYSTPSRYSTALLLSVSSIHTPTTVYLYATSIPDALASTGTCEGDSPTSTYDAGFSTSTYDYNYPSSSYDDEPCEETTITLTQTVSITSALVSVTHTVTHVVTGSSSLVAPYPTGPPKPSASGTAPTGTASYYPTTTVPFSNDGSVATKVSVAIAGMVGLVGLML